MYGGGERPYPAQRVVVRLVHHELVGVEGTAALVGHLALGGAAAAVLSGRASAALAGVAVVRRRRYKVIARAQAMASA